MSREPRGESTVPEEEEEGKEGAEDLNGEGDSLIDLPRPWEAGVGVAAEVSLSNALIRALSLCIQKRSTTHPWANEVFNTSASEMYGYMRMLCSLTGQYP